MRRLKGLLFAVCFGVIAVGVVRPLPGQQTGTLVLDMKNYTSNAKIPKNSQKQLEHAGIRWGLLDSDTLLIPLVNQRYVKADTPYLTRFGEQKQLELKAGEYTVTCIGYEFDAMSRDPDKVISKSGFFNIDVLKFTVFPGKTTTLEISPIYEAESQSRFLYKFTMFLPDLKVRVLSNGAQVGDSTVISKRTKNSVAWDDYKGQLKF
jgi:hypothetical protein